MSSRQKKALIFGITGQDGSYLAEFLLKKKYLVFGVIRRSSAPNSQRIDHLIINSFDENKSNKVNLFYGDLADSMSVTNIINKIKPDEIYNFGAQSHVKVSFEIPEYTSNVVGLGALRILESIRHLGLNKCKYLQASSSEMFGNSAVSPQNEKTIFSPQSPYATAKLMAYWTTVNYRDNYNLFAANSIMFNHESPRRGVNFVTKKIIRGLCEIKLKKRDVLFLGNLEALRDWGYAKEYAEMTWKILQYKKPEDFVIATGRNYSVREFIEKVANKLNFDLSWKGKILNEKGIDRKSKKTIIKIHKNYYRVGEVDNLLGDSTKAESLLGWKPKYNIDNIIDIMIKEEVRLIKENKFY
ncbi:GDP-mannose 4,6-dehydratase [Alphaproteobacteria bacterium]|nr:GDP-mannose 4,6-dehydratase [Alphaproteobacteria bacterium]